MRATTQIRVGITSLLAIQLLTSFAGVGLLARMSPAVTQIVEENVATLEASERMAHALAAGEPAAFEAALTLARANTSDEAEAGAIEQIAANAGAALARDPVADRRVREGLLALSAANRAAMGEADEAARWLGNAGAWAMVVLGLFGFLASTAVARRTQRDVTDPVLELVEVVEAAAAGDIHRRAAIGESAAEFGVLARGLNRLLDTQVRARDTREAPGATALRSAVRMLMDRLPDPAVITTTDGTPIAANAAAEEILLGPDGRKWRAALKEGGDWVLCDALPGETGALCTLAAPASAGAPPEETPA